VSNLTCHIVSPERPLFEGEVDRLVAPGALGELGIYPLHAPLISKLGPGVLRLHQGADVKRMAVRGGFVEVKDDDVILLVTHAVMPEDVDKQTAERDLANTIEELRHPSSEERFAELLEERTWLEVCVRMHA
jgi:F-type H+-transporting ATPase subunit epsilon